MADRGVGNDQAVQHIGAWSRARTCAPTRSAGRPAYWDRERCIGVGGRSGGAPLSGALGQETVHWGRQIAYPNGWLPTPVRLICLR
ncbi:hypothetical protein HMPREF1550_02024 [Actinomyces sp. oral taxon 877 str. F0543]|nr:hypothetical protein HMPREF1550_02024 [Actinomyces sp. oral taxon 877 str. F0543]